MVRFPNWVREAGVVDFTVPRGGSNTRNINCSKSFDISQNIIVHSFKNRSQVSLKAFFNQIEHGDAIPE